VHGKSVLGPGIGVFGESDDGRGGVFQSNKQAQLQLVPRGVPTIQRPQPGTPTPISTSYPILPEKGRAGDLIVTKDERGDVRLWFCVREFVEGGKQAGWAAVVLDKTFDANPRLP
jgi:hypothetical protein